jgi:hypothetical protein
MLAGIYLVGSIFDAFTNVLGFLEPATSWLLGAAIIYFTVVLDVAASLGLVTFHGNPVRDLGVQPRLGAIGIAFIFSVPGIASIVVPPKVEFGAAAEPELIRTGARSPPLLRTDLELSARRANIGETALIGWCVRLAFGTFDGLKQLGDRWNYVELTENDPLSVDDGRRPENRFPILWHTFERAAFAGDSPGLRRKIEDYCGVEPMQDIQYPIYLQRDDLVTTRLTRSRTVPEGTDRMFFAFTAFFDGVEQPIVVRKRLSMPRTPN